MPNYLRTEHLIDPIGLDVAVPRFSWELTDARRGARQTAYQIVFTHPDGSAFHDTGKVASAESHLVTYTGPALKARQALTWRVRTWDADDKPSAFSAPAFFELGLMGEGLGGSYIGSDHVGGPRTSAPPPLLRKPFSLPAAPARARLYITALGLYEARINGSKVGRDELTPGWTDYRKTLLYQTYDVTALLRSGENVLGAVVGDGWYCGSVEWRGRQFYGDRPLLLARLEVTCADGSRHVLTSDGSWKTSTGEVLEADIMHGESIDLRRAQAGWDAPGFHDAAWNPAHVVTPTAVGRLTGQAHEPVRVTRVVAPVRSAELGGWPSGRMVHDFGVNLVGKVRLTVKAEPGTTVRVRYAEVLKGGPASGKLEEGIYLENLRTARATDYFTVGPSGEGTFETRFTFHGFRYAEVQPSPGRILSQSVEALVMHSDYAPTGEFECSDDLLNKLQANITWGWRGNSLDVPTDCPQRDERLGWTGDAQVFVRTSNFLYGTAAFWTKWARDCRDAQSADGGLPCVCPTTNLQNHDGGPAWADAHVICPLTVHLAYGDVRVLEDHYPSLQKWLAQLDATSREGVRGVAAPGTWEGFGDWLSINADTPKDLIGSAFYAYAYRLASDIARTLGKAADAETYAGKFTEIAARFRHHYLTPGGKLVAQTQTAALLALHFELLEPHQRKAVADALVDDIKRRGNRLSCGFVGSPYLNHVLTTTGHLDVAYALLHQTQWPSWLYAVTQGATTIWERWDGWTHDKGFQDAGMNSFNHYAYGAVGAWLYQTVAGLDTAGPGYRTLLIAPKPGGKLTHARAALRTPYGHAESGWMLDGDTLRLRVVVPPNTTARFVPPRKAVVEDTTPLARVPGVETHADGTYTLPAGTYDLTLPPGD